MVRGRHRPPWRLRRPEGRTAARLHGVAKRLRLAGDRRPGPRDAQAAGGQGRVGEGLLASPGAATASTTAAILRRRRAGSCRRSTRTTRSATTGSARRGVRRLGAAEVRQRAAVATGGTARVRGTPPDVHGGRRRRAAGTVTAAVCGISGCHRRGPGVVPMPLLRRSANPLAVRFRIAVRVSGLWPRDGWRLAAGGR